MDYDQRARVYIKKDELLKGKYETFDWMECQIRDESLSQFRGNGLAAANYDTPPQYRAIDVFLASAEPIQCGGIGKRPTVSMLLRH